MVEKIVIGSFQALKSDASMRVWLALGLAKTIQQESSDSCQNFVRLSSSNDNFHKICFWIIAIHLYFISSDKQKVLKEYTC